MTEKRLLSVKEAAEYLKIGRFSFTRAVYKGQIPYIQPSKRKLFKPEDLEQWLNNTQRLTVFTKEEKSIMRTSRSSRKTDKDTTLASLREKYFPKKQNNFA